MSPYLDIEMFICVVEICFDLVPFSLQILSLLENRVDGRHFSFNSGLKSVCFDPLTREGTEVGADHRKLDQEINRSINVSIGQFVCVGGRGWS